MFKQTARLWAHVYAGAPVSSPEYTKKIENLCAMGFDRVSIQNLHLFYSRATFLGGNTGSQQCKEVDSLLPYDLL